jgi:manganese-dependent inorganic pyrophosphatase
MPVWVIGHKNPDTDAICSALGYAEFLRLSGARPDAEAARCGELNHRTQYVLDRVGLEAPRLVLDVRPTIGQIARHDVILADTNESLLEVFNRMREHNLRGIPVLDADGRLAGMLSLSKMLDLLLPGTGSTGSTRTVSSNLRRIAKSLGGTFQNEVGLDAEEDFIMTVGAMSAEAFSGRLREYPADQILLLVGNRPTVQEPAIEYGVRAIIVTGGYELSPELLARAEERRVAVLLSPSDTATTALLVKCAKRITHALGEPTLAFNPRTLLAEAREKIQASNQPLFLALHDGGALAGVFSKSDLIKPPRQPLILVDHNEFSQAVKGVEEAEILEVIDHHRLGSSLTTQEPIRFINEPVGSTCTIVGTMFRRERLTPPPAVALCLAAGIVSDTLHLTGPTTTAVDREILAWLVAFLPMPLKAFSDGFFAAGSALQILTSDAVVRSDCKEYEEADWKAAVAQIEELGLERFWPRKEELQTALSAMRRERGLDFACLLITDITLHDSILLVDGPRELSEAIEYPRLEEGVHELKGVVSRKKQLLPELIRLFQHVRKP